MRKTFQLIQVLDNLSRLPRTGGTLFAGINPNLSDSVAEHSYKVIWLSYILATRLKESNNDIDVDMILRAAIVHDWSEAVLLDIPSGSPSYQSYFEGVDFRKIVKEGERKVNESISELTKEELGEDLMDIELSDKEKAILKVADITALLLEILEWKYSGLKYKWFDYLWSNMFKRLGDTIKESGFELNEFLKELEKAYESGEKPSNPFLTKEKFQSYEE